MQETLNRLRERPKEDRVAIATAISVGVVALLLIGWFFFFMRDVTKGQLEYQRQGGESQAPAEDQMMSPTSTEAVGVSTASSTSTTTDWIATSTDNSGGTPASTTDIYQ